MDLNRVASRKTQFALAMSAAVLAALSPALSLAQSAPITPHAATTPIQHVVIIFQENVSFDHYFGTYPIAANPPGEPQFTAVAGTPFTNGLAANLTNNNPNSTQPFRLDRAQNYTCDQDHDYTPEQQAFDLGLMDKFPEFTGVGAGDCNDYGRGTGLTMGYYDGNTVTALWNYAQHFALNQNFFGTTFGPSTPGALNLVSGNTNPVDLNHVIGDISGDVAGNSVIGDPDPYYDDCGSPEQLAVTGLNIGDLLNSGGITWGWFEGGFKPTVPYDGINPAVCGATTNNLGGVSQKDYSAHHEPFEYYAHSANQHHLPPSSPYMIGRTDQANHQYDLTDFQTALSSGNLPGVTFLKAKRARDGHAGYSSPLDEQLFLVTVINELEASPFWPNTAIFITWDDSDGWYDHVMSPILNSSVTSSDALSGPGLCGNGTPLAGLQGRCGYGPRIPMLVISPWAKANFVDGTLTDQSSLIRFIEDNWTLGRIGGGSYDAIANSPANAFDFVSGGNNPPLYLNPGNGEPK
jgi:phospholipase C